ncbi:4Fe-4S binding protein, partial [Pseudomonas aeruginosa]
LKPKAPRDARRNVKPSSPDAPCARSCPNGAISHVDDSIQVNQQKCIGCKSCVVACPFGTMQIVLTPVAAGKVKATAHKCDL